MNSPTPWSEALNKAAREMSTLGVTESRLGNSRIQLYYEDWDLRRAKKKKAELAERDSELYPTGWVWGEGSPKQAALTLRSLCWSR